MPIEAPEFVKAVISRFENSVQPFFEVGITDELGKAARDRQLSQDERNGLWAESSVFMINPYGPEGSVWGGHFGPLFSGQREDGTPFQNPDLKEMDGDIISYWEARAEETKHPLLKARYADAVWDLKAKVTNQKSEIRFAWMAIDAYLEAVKSRLSKIAITAAQYLHRALDLAVSISDKQRVEQVKNEILARLEHVGSSDVGAWITLYDSLNGMKKEFVTSEDIGRSINALEGLLSQTIKPGSGFDPFAARAAAERLAAHYRLNQLKEEVNRVTRSWCKAFEFLASQGGALLAMSYLQFAYEG